MAESESLKRPRYFTGQLLTAESLELEQKYFREKLKRHNRALHGFGIVSGLKVIVEAGQIIVEPGLALDCQGNELVIGTAVIVSPVTSDWPSAYVQVGFAEEYTDPIPAAGLADSIQTEALQLDMKEASTITESGELFVAEENSNRGHRHLRARWLACGQPHALTIAKLKHSSQGWRVERGYRPPAIK
ncbi:MAG TPA: hypothetical protein VE977_11895 [Pyrinomonadaceae bacterium]|nr:hypothetical protein [Pyrinomonadaceae bacterium]